MQDLQASVNSMLPPLNRLPFPVQLQGTPPQHATSPSPGTFGYGLPGPNPCLWRSEVRLLATFAGLMQGFLP